MVSNIRFQISEDDGKGLNRRLFLAVLLSTLWFPVHGRTSITEDGLQYPFSDYRRSFSRSSIQSLCFSFTEAGKDRVEAQRVLKFPYGPAVTLDREAAARLKASNASLALFTPPIMKGLVEIASALPSILRHAFTLARNPETASGTIPYSAPYAECSGDRGMPAGLGCRGPYWRA
jgi:hypothetical protein